MRSLFLALFLVSAIACSQGPGEASSASAIDGRHSDYIPEGYELVWNDEFEGEGLPDSNNWGYQTGAHGWGKKEMQYYTEARPMNVRVEDGKLIISAVYEPNAPVPYTSTRLVSKNKAEFTYGFFDIRAKLPSGRGLVAGLWMVGDTVTQIGWPNAGEIDIMEYAGFKPDSVYGTSQSVSANYVRGTSISSPFYLPSASTEFNNYSLYWDRDELIWYVNGEEYHRQDRLANFNYNNWPYSWPFYLIMNVAVGGTWGGQQGIDNGVFPAEMEVDYIRVYQEAN